MSKEATIQARVVWAKTAEDCFIAMQNLASMGETLDATKVQLVADQRLGELVALLQKRTRGGHASAQAVVTACDDVILRRVEEKPALVSLGQGDYRRDFDEADFIRDRVQQNRGVTWLKRLLGGAR